MGAEPDEVLPFVVVGALELPRNPRIYRIDVDGANRVLLHEGGFDPAVSPDGKQVAFVVGGNQEAGLYRINSDGSGLKQIAKNTNGSATWLAPSWSPDGKQIAFCTAFPDALFVVDVDGKNMRRVGLGGGMFPAWSTDGGELLFTRMSDGPPRLFVIDVDGIEHKRLVEAPAAMGNWSPDGQWLAYVVIEGKEAGLYVAKSDGTKPKRLAGGPGEITLGPEWSRDSKRIFFSWMAGIEPKEVSEILRREAAGREAIDNSELPAPSAVHVIDLDGQNLRRITNADSMEYSGGSLLFIEGNTEWSDLAKRRMPSTSWRAVPTPKATTQIEGLEEDVADRIQASGSQAMLANGVEARPLSDGERKAIAWAEKFGGGLAEPWAEHSRGGPLTELDLANSQVTDADLSELATFNGIDRLDTLILGSTRVTDEGLKSVAKFGTLRFLDLSDTKVTDVGIENLAVLQDLRSLSLEGTTVTGSGLVPLAKLQHLESLNLRNSGMTDVGLTNVARLANLKSLDLDNTGITASGLKNLKGLKRLEHLVLNLEPRRGRRSKHTTVAMLKALREAGLLHAIPSTEPRQGWAGPRPAGPLEVTSLTLYHPWLTDAGLAEFVGFQNLQELWLDGSGVTDAGLKTLAGFRRLQKLSLSGTAVTDSGLREIAGITTLEDLKLDRTEIGDQALEVIGGLGKLQQLDLTGTRVTDKGLKELTGLKQLRRLMLYDTKVTKAGLTDLRKALPRLRVVHPLVP